MQSIGHAIRGQGHVSHVASLAPGAASQDGQVTDGLRFTQLAITGGGPVISRRTTRK
jgi:hypothetical protein